MIVSNDSLSFIRFILFHSISFHMIIILGELNIQHSMWLLWWAWKQKTPNQIKKTVEGASLGTSWGDFRLTLHGGSCNTAWWHCWTLSWECHTQDETESVCRQRCSSAGKMQERPRRVPGGELAELRQVRYWQAPPCASLLTCRVCVAALWSVSFGSFCQGRNSKMVLSSTGVPTGILEFHLLIVLLPSPGKWKKSTKNSFAGSWSWRNSVQPSVWSMCQQWWWCAAPGCLAKLEQPTWLSVESVSIKINGVNKPGMDECTVS